MPTITLNKKVLFQALGKKLSDAELKDRIPMLGTALENVTDQEIIVEVFPNRPDLLSEQGFARAFASFLGLKTGLKKYTVHPTTDRVIIEPSVNDIRPYTACAVVKNLKFDDENAQKSNISGAPETQGVSQRIKEVIQLQEKLHITYGRNRKRCAIGIYPLEKIKFPIRYLAEEPSRIKFQPLESTHEMTGLQILSQHKAGHEYAHLLEGLDKFPIFIDAKNQILSMPPIINSHLTGKITQQTKEVFIECSGFDYPVVSRCLNIIVAALADLGGQIYSLELHYPRKTYLSPDLTPEPIKISLDYANQILGLNLNEKDLKKYLEAMGHGYEDKKALVPAYRADLLHPIDLVEDVAIAYGYENFQPSIPNVATLGQEDTFEKFLNKVRDILVGFKLQEIKSFHLLDQDSLTKKMNSTALPIKLQNAPADFDCLRNLLLPSGLKTLSENQHHDYPQNIFEIGTVFVKDDTQETKVKESQHLTILLCHENTDFTEIKQLLDAFFQALNLPCTLQDANHPSFITGRVGQINQTYGLVGEIHPQVLTNWSLNVPVTALEINLTELFKLIK